MKIQQEIQPFRAITIKLEKRDEAIAFFNLIDKLDGFSGTFTKEERAMIIGLSSARTEQKIKI